MSRSTPRPSPALVIACLALAVALGGTSYAATLNVPVNSVGTAHLKPNAVVSPKVKNGSLLAVDFKTGQLPAGPRGLKGDKGDKGDAGAPGISGYELVMATNIVTNQIFNSVGATCPAGKRVIGGGGATGGGIVIGDGPYIVVSQPSLDGRGWLVQTARAADGYSNLIAFAICANVS